MIKELINKYKSASVELKATFWFTFTNIFQKGIGTITVPIFTRLMSTEEYGIYSVYLSWYNIIIIFATLNLSYYVYNSGLVKYEDDKEGLTLSFQSLGTFITITLLGLYLIFKNKVNEFTGLGTIITISMFIQFLFILPIGLWSTRQRFDYKYKKLIFFTMAMSVLNPALGVILIKYISPDAISRVLSITIVTIIFGILIYISNVKNARRVVSIKYWKYGLRFNIPLIPHFFSTMILNQSDRIMINSISGNSEAGIYSVAYSAGMLPMLLNNSIHQSILPWLYKKLKKNDINGIKNIFNTLIVLIAALNLIIIIIVPEVIPFFAPSSYYNAIWVIPPVSASVFFMFIYNLYVNIEYYFEETKFVSFSTMGVAILNILLNYLTISKYGYYAAGYTTLISYIILAYAHYIIIGKLEKKYNVMNKIFDHKFYFLISILFLIIITGVVFLYNYFWIRYILVIFFILVLMYNRNKLKLLLNILIKKERK